jgi:tetratricopeptide (TPR) repeat protein
MPVEGREDFVSQAEELARKGHAEEAIAALDRELATARDRPDAWRVKSRVLLQLGDAEKANETIDEALRLFIKEPGLLFGKAELQFFEGNFAAASRTLSRLTRIQPENVEAWLGRGRSLLYDGKAKRALACAEKVIELDWRSAPGYTLRGDSQLQLGHYDEAFVAFVEAAEHDADGFDSSSWSARGDQFLRVYSQPELALRAYERAIESDPENPEGWHGKGTVLKAQGKLDDALTAFQRASEVDKAFIAGLLDAGEIYVECGDPDRALGFFERAKKAHRSDPRPWIAIGGVHEWRLEYEKARAAYEQATKIDPQDAWSWNALGISLHNLNRLDAALESYQRAVEVDPEYGWAYHNLSSVFLQLNRFDEAIQAINRAIELEPQNDAFWINELFILEVTGRIKETDADRALEAAGSDPGVRVHAANILAGLDCLDRARDLLNGVDPSALRDEEERLDFAETLLLIGESSPADDLICRIDSSELSSSRGLVRSFLHLLADRLAGATQLSEELLVDFLRKLRGQVDQIETEGVEWNFTSVNWSFKGVRRLLARCELPVLDKLVLATLIDLQEAKIRRSDLSFFADIWP